MVSQGRRRGKEEGEEEEEREEGEEEKVLKSMSMVAVRGRII